MQNKYDNLAALSDEHSKSQATSPAAGDRPSCGTASSPMTLNSGGPVIRDDRGRYVVQSTEHTATIYAVSDYTTTIAPPPQPSEWPFVRLYDGIDVKRDEALVVQRGDVAGKTPDQIRAFFCLSFSPRFICDASVPVGGVVTYGTLTNQAGDRVRIYLARTRLEFADERPLTLESITPAAASTSSVPRQQRSNPTIPVQPLLPEPVDPHVDFNITNAERHLRQFMAERPVAKIPDEVKIVGPDSFPYVRASLTLDAAGSEKGSEWENSLRGNLVQSLLEEGFGLALWRAGERQPVWVYKYRDVLCLKLFGSLRPPPEYDEKLYADTLDKPLPAGSRIVTGYPSEHIYPPYAKRVLHQRIASATGRHIELDPRLLELPDIDTLRRFKLSIKHLDAATREAISAQANWCLPYAIYF